MRTAIVTLGLSLAACGSPSPDGYYAPPLGPDTVLSMDIDTGGHLTADPGKGVGVFVEYTAGGQWLVWTTCDTTSSGYLCGFDIILSLKPGETLTLKDDTSDLEAPDRVVRIDDGAVRLILQTDTDTDGVWLTAPAGETLEVDVEWDGESAGSTLSWARGGAVQDGAPSNPIDLVPTAP